MTSLTIILATDQQGGIGNTDGTIPWKCSEDLRRFRAVTTGKCLVVGRKTADALPRFPLPGRSMFVCSQSDAPYVRDGASHSTYSNLSAACGAAVEAASTTEHHQPNVVVIGGKQLFEAALLEPRSLVPDVVAIEYWWTHIEGSYDCDVRLSGAAMQKLRGIDPPVKETVQCSDGNTAVLYSRVTEV